MNPVKITIDIHMAEREQEIKRASWVGIFGNAFLSVIKIVAGLISGSLAVVADGIDSSSDIITSVITLITARILTKPPNKKYPYGYDKADTIATKTVVIYHFFCRGTTVDYHHQETDFRRQH